MSDTATAQCINCGHWSDVSFAVDKWICDGCWLAAVEEQEK